MIKKSIVIVWITYTSLFGALRQDASFKQQLLDDKPLVQKTYKAKANQTKFVFVVASYNNEQWYRRNLKSIFSQNYDNYRVIYIDDCSPDNTSELVEHYVKEMGKGEKVTLIRNTKRMKAMANIYKAVHTCADDEVVVMLDGDDWLINEHVLETLNGVYADPQVWLTFGSFCLFPKGKGWAANIPQDVVNINAFRFFQPAPSHLRTFYAGLFKKIDKEDLCENGDFYEYTYDLAMMFPMIEMAAERFQFIAQVLYVYNDANSINDHKVGKIKQRQTDLRIRNKKRYKRLSTLFDNEN